MTYFKKRERLFTQADRDERKGDGFKAREGTLILDIRMQFLPGSVARQRHGSARAAVDAPAPEPFQAGSEGAPGGAGRGGARGDRSSAVFPPSPNIP